MMELKTRGHEVNPLTNSRQKDAQTKSPPIPTIVREKEIHVVVKIPCRYCGVLNDQLLPKCQSCGAALR